MKNFWKFPLVASSYFASKESLSLKDVFRPKIRGQHGAGITTIEPKIVRTIPNTEILTQIFLKISLKKF